MRRRMSVPVYWMALIMLTVATAPIVSVAISTKIARENSAEQLARYEADRDAAAEANRGLYCTLFRTQLDAYAEAESQVGEQAYQAWLDLYRLARCTPAR